ncbi:MAG: hypothetical protein JWM11_3830 [Planctomycetaceae bacterium]|nr:hypothetical protein [Planctomycetaceae bacterium]
MSLWREFWEDEGGALLSAELVAVGTVAVIGTTVGLSTLSKSVNSELQEVAYSIRSLNQSYAFPGHASCRAWTAGSSYTQPDVNQSIHDLVGSAAAETKAITPPKVEEPSRKMRNPDERRKGENRRDENRPEDDRRRRKDDERDQSALPQNEGDKAAVDDVDDESRMETVLEPLTDA